MGPRSEVRPWQRLSLRRDCAEFNEEIAAALQATRAWGHRLGALYLDSEGKHGFVNDTPVVLTIDLAALLARVRPGCTWRGPALPTDS